MKRLPTKNHLVASLLFVLATSLSPHARAVPITEFLNIFDEGQLNVSGEIFVIGERPAAEALADANDLFTANRIVELREIAEAASEQYPDASLPLEVLGAIHFLDDNFDEALATFNRATQLDPEQSGPYSKQGIVFLALEDPTNARSAFNSAIAIDDSDRLAHQQLGLLAEAEGDTETAIDHYRKGLIGTHPLYVGVAMNLGNLLNQQGRFRETVALLTPKLTPSSNNDQALLVLATAFLATGDASSAVQFAQRAIDINPYLDPARLALGIALRNTGDLEESRVELGFLAAKRRDWSTVQLELGWTLLAMDRDEEGNAAITRAIQLGEDAEGTRLRQAQSYIVDEDLDSAIRVYRDAIANDGPSLFTLLALSEALVAQGNILDAQQQLERVIELYPDSHLGYLRLGALFASLQRYSEAIPNLETATQIAENDDTSWRMLSIAYSRNQNLQGAVGAAGELYQRFPGRGDYVVLYASLLADSGDAEQARQVLESEVEREPGNAIALNNLAGLLADEGELDQAEPLARQASSLLPENGQVLDTLAWIQYQRGEIDEASSLLIRADELTPNTAVIKYHQAVVFDAQGNSSGAREAITTAIEIGSQASWIDDARRLLDSL